MRLITLLLFSFLSFNGYSQPPTTQQKLYYTCKVWGFVKYYHSEVSTCHVNWDSVLIHTLPLVRSATTNNEFNDALDTMLLAAGPMTLSSTYFPDTLSTALKRNRDFIWITSSIFRSDVQTILDTIKNNFRPHTECFVERNTYTTNNNGYLIFPYDSLELNIHTASTYPDENHRLLMFFKYWNIISYFNPYNYVLNVPWDSTLVNNTSLIDTASNAYSLYLAYMKIATKLNDMHVFLTTYSDYYLRLPGFYSPYLRLQYIDSQYVVVRSLVPGIYPGDAIISVDGLTTSQWEDSLSKYYSSGNSSAFRYDMCVNLLGRKLIGINESIIIEDSMGIYRTVILPSRDPNAQLAFFEKYIYPSDSLDSIAWTTLPCDIGYVNMGNLQLADVSNMYNDLQNKSAIIFDLRNYPNGTVWNIANLMYPYNMEYAKFTIPDVTYPGTYYWEHDFAGVLGNPTPYLGKVIMLMNEVTLSQAEFSCMILGAMPGSIKVGSQTSGADGTETFWRLSQDLHAGFTSLGVFYPNGDSTQRIGIVPDSIVYPTKAGIRHHRDEVLEKALSITNCNLHANSVLQYQTSVQLFPNPANELITITANNICSDEITIIVTDVIGKELLYTKNVNKAQNISVSLNISTLQTGLYFVTVLAGSNHYAIKLIKN